VSLAKQNIGNSSSSSYGYSMGGWAPPLSLQNVIERYPFALSITNSTDVGDLTISPEDPTGHQSLHYGYGFTTGGWIPSDTSIINKFPFALSITNATDVGDLRYATNSHGGCSSGSYGYVFGGDAPPAPPAPGLLNYLDRFPFSSTTTNAAAVGTISVEKIDLRGNHY
jgi:hypothetical protein